MCSAHIKGRLGETMTGGRLSVVNAFVTYYIFNLRWVHQEVTPSDIKEDLYLC